jgi:hypothetical protein
MSLKHRVAWRNTRTGETSHGEWDNNYEWVKFCTDEGNQEYPHIEHRVESIEFDEKEKP